MRFIQQLPKQFQTKNATNGAKSMFMNSVKKGNNGKVELSKEERYQEIYKEKLNEVRSKALSGAKYTFQLPGTDPTQCKQLSKGAQEIINKIAEKKAKAAEKKMKKADVVKIVPKAFTGLQGGRIDGRGYIYDSAGQWIMTVDKKTGKIKNRKNGCTVGKYNPNCGYSEHRLAELIGQLDTTKQAGWWAGAQGHAGSTPADNTWGSGGSIWGNEQKSDGGIWGTGGSIWGSTKSDSDNNGGGWW